MDTLFWRYFSEWVDVYKRGAVRPVTLAKYKATLSWLQTLAPSLKMRELTRRSYQSIINDYAKTHEKQTVSDFNTHLKAAILDAIDEGIISANPCRNVVIKGMEGGKSKKNKALSVDEFEKLLKVLIISSDANFDSFIYLIAKTGMRFAEALAITPKDFDFERRTVSISKTLDYKSGSNTFVPTKTKSSVRTIDIDHKTCDIFRNLLCDCNSCDPVFANLCPRFFNSTFNNHLFRLCKKAGVPLITIHGLRHTHASILFCSGVSVLSVSKRLGHANVNITQSTYLHLIKDLEDKDTKKITGCLSEF